MGLAPVYEQSSSKSKETSRSGLTATKRKGEEKHVMNCVVNELECFTKFTNTEKDSFKSGLLPVDFHLCIVLHTFHQIQI